MQRFQEYNRRTVNMQIDTNEPGRIIDYHGKVLKALQLFWRKRFHNRYSKNFSITINVNDYVEHRAEVLQKLCSRQRVPSKMGSLNRQIRMSNSERKIIHCIVLRWKSH